MRNEEHCGRFGSVADRPAADPVARHFQMEIEVSQNAASFPLPPSPICPVHTWAAVKTDLKFPYCQLLSLDRNTGVSDAISYHKAT